MSTKSKEPVTTQMMADRLGINEDIVKAAGWSEKKLTKEYNGIARCETGLGVGLMGIPLLFASWAMAAFSADVYPATLLSIIGTDTSYVGLGLSTAAMLFGVVFGASGHDTGVVRWEIMGNVRHDILAEQARQLNAAKAAQLNKEMQTFHPDI